MDIQGPKCGPMQSRLNENWNAYNEMKQGGIVQIYMYEGKCNYQVKQSKAC